MIAWVAYVLFLRNRKQLLRSVYVYVAYWTFFIFGRGKNADDGIIWRTPCSTSADPLGVADPRLKTSAVAHSDTCSLSVSNATFFSPLVCYLEYVMADAKSCQLLLSGINLA